MQLPSSPALPSASPVRPMLRVVTYNIRHAKGIDDKVDLRRIAGVLQAIDADVVCLQEVDAGNPRSRRLSQARWLGEMLGMHARFGPTLGVWPFPRFGNAILTKQRSHSTWNIPMPWRKEPRKLLKTTIKWQGQDVHLLCSHWGLNAQYRMRQARVAVEFARRVDGPVILCGDFNAPAHSPEVAALTSEGRFSFGEAEGQPLLTFPSSHPDVQIDFVLPAGLARVVSWRVVQTPASDHLPVVAEVDLSAPSGHLP